MSYQTNSIITKEELPWPPYIPKDADKLLLGTFPPIKEKRDYRFYYPNSANKFWKILAAIAGTGLSRFEDDEATVQERKDILDTLQLAVTDMGKVILRQGESSLDYNIFPVVFMDIFGILDENPTINTIILTSSSKGSSVLSWFGAYCEINGKILKFPDGDFPKVTHLTHHDRQIKLILVCSTSGAAGKSFDYLYNLYSSVIAK